ncbi:MAG: TolC family protein [Bacteroidetes bacterium]|nr:TolC family protein [Bacteroidota bacterium]
MKVLHYLIYTAVISLLNMQSMAQSANWSLQQCIDSALRNNLSIQQNELLKDATKVGYRQSKENLLPDLNANLNHGINTGRSIDPYSNTYVDQTIRYAGYGASSGLTLFNGLSLQHSIKQNKAAYEASVMEWQQVKDNITLNTILAYLTVLNNADLLTQAINQKELSNRQLLRLQVLDSLGAVSPSQVSDLKGQVMNDDLSILNAKNQLETAKLNLAQLMNVPYTKDISLQPVNADEFLTAYDKNATEIFNAALQSFSLIKAVELRKKSAVYGLKSSKGALFPVLSLSGDAQTNYSSSALNSNGTKIGYNQQVRNNIYTTVNLGLRIPIFNRFRQRNTIKLAEINVRTATLNEAVTKQQLQQQVEQAHLNMMNAYETYKTLLQQVDAYATSFRAAEIRFQSGVGTSVDYLIAKNNLDRANINLLVSKYDFVLRKKILDYYQNIEQKK